MYPGKQHFVKYGLRGGYFRLWLLLGRKALQLGDKVPGQQKN
jgi:hypothetical protein